MREVSPVAAEQPPLLFGISRKTEKSVSMSRTVGQRWLLGAVARVWSGHEAWGPRPPAAMGRHLCPFAPHGLTAFLHTRQIPPHLASGVGNAGFSLGVYASPRGRTCDRKQPACGSSGMNTSRPSASLCLCPLHLGTDLDSRPVGALLSPHPPPVSPLCLPTSQSSHHGLPWRTAKPCLLATDPASAGTLSVVGCLPGTFQRRAGSDGAVAACLGEHRRGDVKLGVMGLGWCPKAGS